MIGRVILGVVLMMVGIVQYFKPDLFWWVKESWKSERRGDPSETYKGLARFRGGMLALAGAFIIVVAVVSA